MCPKAETGRKLQEREAEHINKVISSSWHASLEAVTLVRSSRSLIHITIRVHTRSNCDSVLIYICADTCCFKARVQIILNVSFLYKNFMKTEATDMSITAFLKLWSADHKWSSGSALVVLLD